MPKKAKTYPKHHLKVQRKTTQKKAKPKAQPEKVSILKSKYYWATLTLIIFVTIIALGVSLQISLGKEAFMLGTIFSVIGFAFYVGFKSSERYSKRATFFFVGASVIGFSIWALMVLSFNATGLTAQIADSIGVDFFAITSLVICLVLGALIGDLIGKNRERMSIFANDNLRK
jgi:predicted neutral ceramidase superfamily lipid hydrolase